MRHADFHIGLEFVATAGLRWRCTDIGTRTILAVQLNKPGPIWYQGPPYIVSETVFDEYDIKRCYLSDAEALEASIQEHKTAAHPGYSAVAVLRMMEAELDSAYPNRGVLRFDRCRSDGEILHPYSGRLVGDVWFVELYLPFAEGFEVMSEIGFIALPRASDSDIRKRATKKQD